MVHQSQKISLLHVNNLVIILFVNHNTCKNMDTSTECSLWTVAVTEQILYSNIPMSSYLNLCMYELPELIT